MYALPVGDLHPQLIQVTWATFLWAHTCAQYTDRSIFTSLQKHPKTRHLENLKTFGGFRRNFAQ